MTYSGDPSTSDLDAIRFWLQDTSSTTPLLNDDELRYFVDYAAGYSSDPILLAAALCSVIMSKYAGVAEISGDGITYSQAALQDKYSALATSLRDTWTRMNQSLGLPYAGGVEWCDGVRLNAKPALFAIGRNDIHGALQLSQDDERGELAYNDGELF